MKKSIKILAVASVAMLSATVFAGKAPNVGSGGQGTGATTTAAAITTAIAAVGGQSAGVTVTTSPSGAITIAPTSPAGGGISFPPTTVTVPGGGSYTISANNGTITMTPIAE